MSKEILMVAEAVSNEKGVDQEIIFEAIEIALATVAAKRYSEDVDIRVFGSTAIVAFKLVGSSVSKAATSTTYYFNTGTFVKRNGQWRAVAWQATKIPESEGS